MKIPAWLFCGAIVGCAGLETPDAGVVTGRIITTRRFDPEDFIFSGRTYVDRSLRVDAAGGVADAAVYLEGRETVPWISGKVVMSFGENQFDPRVAFVSPGEPVEILDTRDDNSHDLTVRLEGLSSKEQRFTARAWRPARPIKPEERTCFECKNGVWTIVGNKRFRTRELSFDRPALVPLDWD